jgi:endonuclease/exonuclease/phosphatase family metal-dependent hydrolase
MRKFIKMSLVGLNILCVLFLFLAHCSRIISPRDNECLQFIGLAFPGIIAVICLFFIFWIIKGSKWKYLSLISMIIGLGMIIDYFGNPFSWTGDKGTYSAMTYNVRLFGFYQWDDNIQIRDSMMVQLANADADVYCFQEFYFQDRPGGFETFPHVLKATNTTFKHEKYTHEFKHDQYFGVVTLSRHPIVNRGFIAFEEDFNNYCIYSDIVFPESDTVRVFNTHLASIHFRKDEYGLLEGKYQEMNQALGSVGEILSKLKNGFDRRSLQIERIMNVVSESPYPVILAGDFNDTPISYTYGIVREGLDDAYVDCRFGMGNTYNGPVPYLRIDHIFHDNQIEVETYDSPKVPWSDHFPVICSFEINKDK